MSKFVWAGSWLGLGALIVSAGCAGRPSLLPNGDPNLRKTSAEFAADAAKRHPFHADLPHGGEALARCQVDYTFKTLELLNYGDEEWDDVEIWVNQNFVCYIPKIEKGKERTKLLNFQMLYDANGNYFWTDGGKILVKQLEMVHDGKIYSVPLALAD